MQSNLCLTHAIYYRPGIINSKNSLSNQAIISNDNQETQFGNTPDTSSESLLLGSLNALAAQNGYAINKAATPTNTGTTANAQDVSKISKMLESGDKEGVKAMGSAAVPALVQIAKDTKQPMQVRTDAVATLAKLVDEGIASANVLVDLCKDENTRDMAERGLANVGEEAMPAVKQMLQGADPKLRESAKNILNDMLDAWAGYEDDPKWGAECKRLMPEVNKLLGTSASYEAGKQKAEEQKLIKQNGGIIQEDDPNNPKNLAGFTRQFSQFSAL